jgi:3-oxoacyl-[acyl-carrier protein] reductase
MTRQSHQQGHNTPSTYEPRMDGSRTLIVGGGGAGIGRAITNAVAGVGAHVAVVDLDPVRAGEAARAVEQAGGRAVGLAADVRRSEDIERVVAEARDRLGGVDTLITIVGGMRAFNIPLQRVHEYSDAQLDLVLDLNFRYAFRVTRAVLRVMLEQGTGGTIVSVGSHAGGGQGAPLIAPYGAAKSALAHLAMTVTTEYGPQGIRMNVVAPGSIGTPAAGERSAVELGFTETVIPLGRRGSVEDIAAAVLYLASPMSNYVSGVTLGVDGGVGVANPLLGPAGRRE